VWVSVRSHVGREQETPMAVSANLDTQLDKEWESKSLTEILEAPVSALAGVTDADGDRLREAFNIRTVADLGSNNYFRSAYAMTMLADTGGK
jgi:hypothetical protein